MAITAEDLRDRPDGVPGCWCCGDGTAPANLLRLSNHPEVGICTQCVRILARRRRELERRSGATPIGWPFWRRVLFRLGFNRC
jgi:hypothetical protein